jgi:hypothetical protein
VGVEVGDVVAGVGVDVGAGVGVSVGAGVGADVGVDVDADAGAGVGADVGAGVGLGAGVKVGDVVAGVGADVGAGVGVSVGAGVGADVGVGVDADVGAGVGTDVGAGVGLCKRPIDFGGDSSARPFRRPEAARLAWNMRASVDGVCTDGPCMGAMWVPRVPRARRLPPPITVDTVRSTSAWPSEPASHITSST